MASPLAEYPDCIRLHSFVSEFRVTQFHDLAVFKFPLNAVFLKHHRGEFLGGDRRRHGSHRLNIPCDRISGTPDRSLLE